MEKKPMKSEEDNNIVPFKRPASDGGFIKTNWLAHQSVGTIFAARRLTRDHLRYLCETFHVLNHTAKTTSLLTLFPDDTIVRVHTWDFSEDWELVEVLGHEQFDRSDPVQGLGGDEKTQGSDKLLGGEEC